MNIFYTKAYICAWMSTSRIVALQIETVWLWSVTVSLGSGLNLEEWGRISGISMCLTLGWKVGKQHSSLWVICCLVQWLNVLVPCSWMCLHQLLAVFLHVFRHLSKNDVLALLSWLYSKWSNKIVVSKERVHYFSQQQFAVTVHS